MAIFGLATVVHAAMSPISPSSGTVSPGGSTTAEFTMTSSLATCVVATYPGQFSVSFDGLGLGVLPANCGLGETDVLMSVTASANVSPGDYEVMITEVALLGGDLIDTHTWPFTVEAPPPSSTTTTSTTTTSTITTSSTTSTTAPASTSSTASPVETTTSTSAAHVTTTTKPPATTTSSGEPVGAVADVTTSTSPGSTTSTDSGEDGFETVPGRLDDGSGGTAGPGPEAGVTPVQPGSAIPVSDQLRDRLATAVPLGMAEAVLSPFTIAEFLFRSLLGSAVSLAVPLLIASVLASGMVWRMRREVTDDELSLT